MAEATPGSPAPFPMTGKGAGCLTFLRRRRRIRGLDYARTGGRRQSPSGRVPGARGNALISKDQNCTLVKTFRRYWSSSTVLVEMLPSGVM